ncbi:DUF805 domain-containing protein [Rhizobium viscosum]|uniref:Uncharacterized membrane protein YhaH (DUF805 family) n=1 Tax=Rhizobium viscosum TaxID=1673 RepID=A0ABR9IT92_RHIVS|nr:DUF805 domain-containing protein [Rhizobium viscosum]MBE1506415.1 uncharacterized membrane protein YhaH (DUF805 family) [Rhizobium viscosum]
MHYFTDVYKDGLKFSCRLGRKAYWLFILANVLLSIPIGFVLGFVSGFFRLPESVPTFAWLAIYAVFFMIPNISATVRRLHDANFRGWWCLIMLIPYLGGLALTILLIFPSKPEGARFDRDADRSLIFG